MNQQLLVVEKERFYLNDGCRYVLEGIIPDKYKLEAYLDGLVLDLSMEKKTAKTAVERFKDEELMGGVRVAVTVTLPENLEPYRRLEVYAAFEEDRQIWFRIKASELLARRGKPQYFIEDERVIHSEKKLILSGWAAAETPVQIKLFDEKKQPIPVEVKRNNRMDVVELFQECPVEKACGFYAEVSPIYGRYLYLVIRDQNGEKAFRRIGLGAGEVFFGKASKYGKKAMDYLKAHGAKALAVKTVQKLTDVNQRPVDYGDWLPKHMPSRGELEKQRRTAFPENYKFSIVVPLYKTGEEYLKALIQSVQNQTYGNWELCLSDGSGADSPIRELLMQYEKEDSRIKVVYNDRTLQISENTNAAIGIAAGDFIVFADHDDVLTENALFECAKALSEHPQTQVLYSDEDKMSMNGNKFFQPNFKPDFNLDLLCTVNYICHLFVAKRELLDKVGLLRPEFDGAQDYDFVLRCTEAAEHIYHIPKILYHWRSHEDSTAENPESKMYAFDAGERAVQAHFDRIGVKAEVYKGEFLGLYRTRYIRAYDPLVSIIIPNKDHTEDLDRCIKSIEEKSTYRNFEYIIVENNSTEGKTFEYYKEMVDKYPKAKVVYWDREFNYSEINNFGASHAKGEYLLLLNNDTEVINEDWLEEMLGYCMRPDVGIVGARLYYEDDTVQHAGVVLGFGGIAGHCFVQQPRGATGYQHRIICAQDYSAVTAACLMVRRSVFEEVGGLSADLAVAFNDIDFCLKVRNAGYLVVYNPYVELHHYESKSRGLENTPEKKERFNKEVATLEAHWPEIFSKPDPYYNPNLTLKSQDFSLKRL